MSPLFAEIKLGLSSQLWAFGSTEIVQNRGESAALDVQYQRFQIADPVMNELVHCDNLDLEVTRDEWTLATWPLLSYRYFLGPTYKSVCQGYRDTGTSFE